MLNYAICEISGKQYRVIPGETLEVNLQRGADQNIDVKVLLLSEDGKLKIGNPYLKDSLKLERVGNVRGEKIRVSKFHAKANYRKTVGFRSKITKVILALSVRQAGVKKAS